MTHTKNMDFEEMIKEAEKHLKKNEKNSSIATVFLTENGSIYIDYCTTCPNCCRKTCDDYSLDDMIKAGENRVLKMVTVIKQEDDFIVEAPCEWLRRFIYEMNNDNINAEVMSGNKIRLLKDFFPHLC